MPNDARSGQDRQADPRPTRRQPALFPHPDPWRDGSQAVLDALESRLRTKAAPGPLARFQATPDAEQRATAHEAFRARLRATKGLSAAGSATSPAPARGPLGNTESRVSPAGHSDHTTAIAARRAASAAQYGSRRLDRMMLRDLIQEVTQLKSLRGCERGVLQGGVSLRVKEGGTASFAGLWRCGSVWACPCCSAKVRAARAAELERLAVAWTDAGHGLAMATLTVRHWSRARLAPQLDGVAKSWQKVQAGAWWAGRTNKHGEHFPGFKERYGLAGVTRAMEITHGDNGWHTHLHVLIWTDAPMDRETAARMEGELYDKWLAKVTAAGLGKPTREHGVKVDPVRRGKAGAADLAKYVAKIQEADGAERALGNEMTRGDLKTGRKGSRVPFEIIADHFRKGTAEDLELWREYEDATKGRRMLTWSRGLRDLLAELLDEDLDDRTDEELAAADEGQGDEVAYFPLAPWREHIARVPGRRPALINAAQADGERGVRALVTAWGLVWGRDVLPPLQRP